MRFQSRFTSRFEPTRFRSRFDVEGGVYRRRALASGIPGWVPAGAKLHLDHENTRYWLDGVGVVNAWTDLPGAVGDIDATTAKLTLATAGIDISGGFACVLKGQASASGVAAVPIWWSVTSEAADSVHVFINKTVTDRHGLRSNELGTQIVADAGISVFDNTIAHAVSAGAAGRALGLSTSQSVTNGTAVPLGTQVTLNLLSREDLVGQATGSRLDTFTLYEREFSAAECVTLAQGAM